MLIVNGQSLITLGSGGSTQSTQYVDSHVGDQIQLEGELFIDGGARLTSPSNLAESFQADGSAITAIRVAPFPLGDVVFAPDVETPADSGEVGYIADSGTVYPTQVPEPNLVIFGILGLLWGLRHFRRELICSAIT